MNRKIYDLTAPAVLCFALLTGCVATEPKLELEGKVLMANEGLKPSSSGHAAPESQIGDGSDEALPDATIRAINPPYRKEFVTTIAGTLLSERFSNQPSVSLSSDALPLDLFLHNTFGEILGLNYMLDEKVTAEAPPITLNITDKISERRVFELTRSILEERGFNLEFDDDIYKINSVSGPRAEQLVYAFGNRPEDVPNTNLTIMQIVPFEFGYQGDVTLILSSLSKVQALPFNRQNAFFLKGSRQEIIKALDYLAIVDRPTIKAKNIAVYSPKYLSPSETQSLLVQVLKQEGLEIGGTDKALSIITVNSTNTMLFFANNEQTIDRVKFWLAELDVAPAADEARFFYFEPKYSKATELAESVSKLLGDLSSGEALSDTTSADAENRARNDKRVNSGYMISDEMRMIVDTRSNALIFRMTSEKYNEIFPLLEKLDVLPKQIMLEMLIAEVTMTDEFKQGLEFALVKGNYGLSTEGAFMGSGFGGLSYLLSGDNFDVTMNLLMSNSLINIISRPSLVVRDGQTADIVVGTDIPIAGETTSDPINGQRQTTSIEYRTTGVQLNVSPVINSNGVVTMKISQSMSNTVDLGSAASLNPSVFQRAINTEVVAESGQTILLGGLISENKSSKRSGIPGLQDLPLLGKLFKADTDSSDKTELVVLVTPHIISGSEDWTLIKDELNKALQGISL